MSDLTLTEASAEYGAVLGNRNNEWTAIAKDNSVVISCWERWITCPERGVWRYEIPDVSAWPTHGLNVLMRHLSYAFTENRSVRIVVVREKQGSQPGYKSFDEAKSGREVAKTYHVRKDFVGKVISLGTTHFSLEFQRTNSDR